MTSIFISHASPDKAFALRLAICLEELGYSAWVDVHQIRVGDSIPRAVADALDRADYLVLVLSGHSVASSWCTHEWYAKYWDEVASRRAMVLPLLLTECEVPLFLRSKRYADFRTDYALGLAQLTGVLREPDGCPAAALACLTSPVPVLLPWPGCYSEGSMNPPGRLVEVHDDLDVPYLGRVSGVWKSDEREQDAAWELYVELVTQVAAVEQIADDGLLRESLSSLYSIFTTTRQLLWHAGSTPASCASCSTRRAWCCWTIRAS